MSFHDQEKLLVHLIAFGQNLYTGIKLDLFEHLNILDLLSSGISLDQWYAFKHEVLEPMLVHPEGLLDLKVIPEVHLDQKTITVDISVDSTCVVEYIVLYYLLTDLIWVIFDQWLYWGAQLLLDMVDGDWGIV